MKGKRNLPGVQMEWKAKRRGGVGHKAKERQTENASAANGLEGKGRVRGMRESEWNGKKREGKVLAAKQKEGKQRMLAVQMESTAKGSEGECGKSSERQAEYASPAN